MSTGPEASSDDSRTFPDWSGERSTSLGAAVEAEIQSLLDHAEAHDHYTPWAEHFVLLEDAGLTGVDCVWRDLTWGIVTADRSDAA